MNRLRLDFAQRFYLGRAFLLPFRRATKDAGVLHRDLAMCQECLDRVAHLVSRYQFGTVAIVDTPFITEAAAAVENEGVWRRLRPIRVCDRLRLAIVKIRIAQMFLLGAELHFFETVAHVRRIQLVDGDRFGIIRFDRDNTHAAIRVIRC